MIEICSVKFYVNIVKNRQNNLLKIELYYKFKKILALSGAECKTTPRTAID